MYKTQVSKRPQVFGELQMTYKTISNEARPILTNSRQCSDYLRRYWSDQIEYREDFNILLVNRANKLIGFVEIAKGGISECAIDIRMIFQSALLAHASGIVISHNHPSGSAKPSEADRKLTKDICIAATFMKIPVFDHIILTSESYYSFADECEMPNQQEEE